MTEKQKNFIYYSILFAKNNLEEFGTDMENASHITSMLPSAKKLDCVLKLLGKEFKK